MNTHTHTHSLGMFTCWEDLIPACLTISTLHLQNSGSARSSSSQILCVKTKKTNGQEQLAGLHFPQPCESVPKALRIPVKQLFQKRSHMAALCRCVTRSFLRVHVPADAVRPHPSVSLQLSYVNARPTSPHKQHGTNVLSPHVASSSDAVSLVWPCCDSCHWINYSVRDVESGLSWWKTNVDDVQVGMFHN